jgi:hypothetical protein
MGLDCSHDAFHGAYSAFNRFRQAVAKAMSGSYPPHGDNKFDPSMWYWGDGYSKSTHPGLYIFFCHSDCEGEISPDDCKLIADELEELLPKIDSSTDWGHIEREGGFKEVTKRFITGCRSAHAAGEPLEFY